jgi:hypothetical protein
VPLTGALPWRIKQAVLATLVGLDLAEIGTRWYSKFVPDQVNILLPCGLVTSGGQAESIGDGTTEGRDTEFGFVVWLADRHGPRESDREAVWLDWRKAAMDAFREDQIEAFAQQVPEVWNLALQPQPQVEDVLAGMPQYQMLVGGFIVRVTAREART